MEAIQWIDALDVPNTNKTVLLAMTYWYSRSSKGESIESRAKCPIRGNMMKPGVHYNLDNTATYSVKKQL